MHREYILLNGFRKAKKGFTAGFHVPLTGSQCSCLSRGSDGEKRGALSTDLPTPTGYL